MAFGNDTGDGHFGAREAKVPRTFPFGSAKGGRTFLSASVLLELPDGLTRRVERTGMSALLSRPVRASQPSEALCLVGAMAPGSAAGRRCHFEVEGRWLCVVLVICFQAAQVLL